ncbi:anti-sigma factor domain-containing protein [Kitasatospora indigofera]|uniref:anti-sigma factor n=1 Tax=Kitasatospora indigofera TaxID=67307 RepID=UPI0036A70A9C
MQHSDQGDLAMIALGEAPAPSEAAHLLDCSRCAADLAALRRTVGAARPAPYEDGPPGGGLVQPPPDVWDAIAAELGLDLSTGPGAQAHAAGADIPEPGTPAPAPASGGPGHGPAADAARPLTPAAVLHPLRIVSPADTVPAEGSSADPVPSRLVPSDRGRRRYTRRASLALAACTALLGAAAGSGLTLWGTDRATDPVPPVAATAPPRTLAPLVPAAAGSAALDATGGTRRLEITVRGLPTTSGYFEVWLMDRDHKKLISMGVLGPDGHAVLPVPTTVDLAEYSVVDVSVQQYNGSPAHSGQSIVRGPYTA